MTRKTATQAAEVELQKLLDRIVADSQKAEQLARQLYGHQGNIFAEADGGLFAMSGDADEGARARQAFIKLTAKGMHRLGVGAW
ncbi:hypothetical protein ABGT16_05325 [Pseudomonas asiatica]|uniref:hypothetical protein n=1 Tax=Pseudomonas TaxID=286 RepID=UPI001BAED80C|nr:hypothetical protein [Pseudomonas putida]QUG93162.1 hypothetical protein GR140_30855 [Pseudomonas putida]